MDNRRNKVIGIVGGMGPKAGVALVNSIIGQTSARTDQEHLSTILMSFPEYFEDRTSFLEGVSKTNPAYCIASVIRNLESAGANVVGIACNTSHAPEIYNVVLEQLEKGNSQIKLLNMPYETCRYLKKHYPWAKRVGIMASNGTYGCGLYTKLLQSMDFKIINHNRTFQNEVVHKMIYDRTFGIKSNGGAIAEEVTELMERAFDFFKKKEADAIILGCTEFSLVPISNSNNNILIADSTYAFAQALITEAVSADKYRVNPMGVRH